MLKRNVFLTLDCSKPGSQYTVEGLHVGDKRSCELHILLRNGITPLVFDDENIAVIMNAQKPDGTTISALCDISTDKKEVVYTLDVQDTAVEGVVNYELIVAAYDGDEYCVLYSASFSTVVSAGIVTPVFRQLESEPDNWATDYKKYFRHTENGYVKINDETCPEFSSDDFFYLVNPNYDSENDYSAFENTVANVQQLTVRMTAVETNKANANDVYSKSDMDSQLAAKADNSSVYNKTQTDTLLAAKANSSDVTAALATKANAAVVYTKTEADTLLAAKANSIGYGSNDELIKANNSGVLGRSGYSIDGNSSHITTTATTKVPTAKAVAEKLAEKADADHTHSQYLTSHQDISGKENKTNKVTSMSSDSTDTQYPSAKAVYDAVSAKANSEDVYSKTATDALLSAKAAVDDTWAFVNLNGENFNKIDEMATDAKTIYRVYIDYNWGLLFNIFNINYHSQIVLMESGDILYRSKAVSASWGNISFTSIIPSKTSDLTNDSGFLTSHQSLANYYNKTDVNNLLSGKANSSHSHTGMENTSNKVTSVDSNSTDTQYPSAKAVYDALCEMADGKSAYQVAVDNGYEGTVEQWLASLVGATGAAGADGVSVTHSWDGTTLIVTSASGTSSANLKGAKGSKGATGATGATGADGKSAYQVAVDNGFEGTEVQWLASLVGATGAAGADWIPSAQEKTAIAAEAAGMIDIPTKTSDLTNDSGFIPLVEVDSIDDCTENGILYLVNGVEERVSVFYYILNLKWMEISNYISWMQIRINSDFTISIRTRSNEPFGGGWAEWTDFTNLEDTYNRVNAITNANKASTDIYPSVKAVVDYISAQGFLTSHQDISSKYEKPSGGIPKTDLASAVQTSLGKADSSVQPADVYLKSALTTKTLSVTDGNTTTNYSVLVVNN